VKIKDVRLSILRTELDETVIPTQGAVDKLPQLVLVSVSTHEGLDGNYISYLIPAKAADLPRYKYLGAHRHKIRAYASTVAYPTIDGYLDAIRGAVAEGFTAAKFHPFRDARRDIELARAIRHEFPDIDLMIDPVCAYTVPEALAVGRVLDDLNFYWFENPISDFDLKGLSFLASKLNVPLSVGEQNFAGFPAMRDYLKAA
jgi:L-alanine-DL-glutamate epimerase-like enolase superfamily enzyme